MPAEACDRVLDINCATVFAALAMVDRFHPRRITASMRRRRCSGKWARRFADASGTELELQVADVLEMPVAPAPGTIARASTSCGASAPPLPASG
jgi:hypothetical protein